MNDKYFNLFGADSPQVNWLIYHSLFPIEKCSKNSLSSCIFILSLSVSHLRTNNL